MAHSDGLPWRYLGPSNDFIGSTSHAYGWEIPGLVCPEQSSSFHPVNREDATLARVGELTPPSLGLRSKDVIKMSRSVKNPRCRTMAGAVYKVVVGEKEVNGGELSSRIRGDFGCTDAAAHTRPMRISEDSSPRSQISRQ